MFKGFSKYLPQIIAMLFLAGFVAYAWTEPPQAPPDGNVDAPINVGNSSQLKSGALGLGGLFHAFSDAIFDGKVGIGTTNPSQLLDIVSGTDDAAIHLRTPGDVATVFTQTFNYTGGEQRWTVPMGVGSITIEARGAQGVGGEGSADGPGGVGGKGARIYNASFSVTGGEALYIYIGGNVVGGQAGGFNGGGLGGSPNWCGDDGCTASGGGGGGGASDVRKGGNALSNRIIVAGAGGGGGGATWSCGSGVDGGAGGASGQNGNDGLPSTGGNGGTQLAGGAGGTGGGVPQPGSIGQGGFGGAGYGNMDTVFCGRGGAGGGGGGGYYGGGGGASDTGGGGGGSSLVPAGANISSGFQTGNGQVFITYTANVENWTMGVDQSDAGKFKISRRTDALGVNDALTIDPATGIITGNFNPVRYGLYGVCQAYESIINGQCGFAKAPAYCGSAYPFCRCPTGYEVTGTGNSTDGWNRTWSFTSCYKQ